jgi:hypothetical protein
LVEVEHPLIESSTCSRVTVFGRSRTPSDIVFKVVYFYQILSPFNKLKTISESVLLLPNNVTLKQAVEHPLIVFNLFKGDIIW